MEIRNKCSEDIYYEDEAPMQNNGENQISEWVC